VNEPAFDVIVITDWARAELLEQVEAVLARHQRVAVQHRHPGASDRLFVEQARALAQVCARHRAPLFINGRLEVALLTGAHLHLPATGLRAEDVRPALRGRLISAAVHSAAEAQPVDLALVSPVFTPGSKPLDRRPPLGVAGFDALARQLACPCFALGGVSAQTAGSLRHAAGLAVISEVVHAQSPPDALAALREAWHAA
jgi:thiamine-phosphate pyrophosphorylase